MANFNSPRGLSPVGTLNGAVWNQLGQTFAIANDASNTYAIGDVVKLAGGADTNGIAYVSKAATTDVPCGVIVGFRVADSGVSLQGTNLNLAQIYLSKSAGLHYAVVVTDPNTLFEIESDATGVSAANVGSNASMTITADQTSSLTQSSPLSATVLNGSGIIAQGTTGSLALPLTIIGIRQAPDNSTGAYANVQVIFNRHQFKQAQGTA